MLFCHVFPLDTPAAVFVPPEPEPDGVPPDAVPPHAEQSQLEPEDADELEDVADPDAPAPELDDEDLFFVELACDDFEEDFDFFDANAKATPADGHGHGLPEASLP